MTRDFRRCPVDPDMVLGYHSVVRSAHQPAEQRELSRAVSDNLHMQCPVELIETLTMPST
jgi:hypothetical protein